MKAEKAVFNWLILGVILIVLMVGVGGAVRLTNSGLSIVEWAPVKGVIPPLNKAEWQAKFEAYQQIPEFTQEHSYFNLEDFKKIYLWEYFHRLIARLIGLVFVVPFLFFWIKGYFVDRKLLIRVILIFFIALFQAWLGWFMVSSGLSKLTDVNHYRLAIHLLVAIFLASYVLWTALDLKYNYKHLKPVKYLKYFILALIAITTIQIVFGAFTAGLNAGYYYMSYPKMGMEWFPKEARIAFQNESFLSFFEHPGMVHFIHRWFAVVVVLSVLLLYLYLIKKQQDRSLRIILNVILALVCWQFLLGVFTLLLSMNIFLAVWHQINGILLFLSMISLLYFVRKT